MIPVRLDACAKLTLSLRITGKRADGYHLLSAEMTTIDLADTLYLREGDGLVVHDATGLHVPADESNLVRRALRLAGRNAQVDLHKRIPAGAGLGGGSADAAAVLRWAGWTELDRAASLGADVPFCLVGGRAQVTGIGEIITRLSYIDEYFTLLIPPLTCSTAMVYGAWDALGGPEGPGVNDLETAALKVEPRLAKWRDELGNTTGQQPILAGAGSTWFVPGAFPGSGRVVARTTKPATPLVSSEK